VATADSHYTGKHVVYSFDLPVYTNAKIELVPADPKTDVSLYAYSTGPSFPMLPPKVAGPVSCEASPAANRAPNPGGTEKVELVAITRPYKVFVGVAGADSALTGSFTLKVTLSPR
jgi:hypothetical protein